MRSENLTTEQVLDVFSEELAARGGKVTDTFNDGRRLFCRSILPKAKEVRPGDRLQGGVAIRFANNELCLFPYTFRIVCRNGAIEAQSIAAVSIPALDQQSLWVALESIRDGIARCCAKEVFSKSMRRMRTTLNVDLDEIDMVLELLAHFSRHADQLDTAVLNDIVDGFFAQAERTQFALANTITAIARDTEEPALRWDLEELGGAVLVGKLPKLPRPRARSVRPKRARGARTAVLAVA